MKHFLIMVFLFFAVAENYAQKVSAYQFAERDSQKLFMDVYQPIKSNKICLLFVHGGGFSDGNRQADSVFFKKMASENFMVVSIDYRLGMKGVTKVGVMNTKPIEHAIKIAVEDLYSAVDYLRQNSDKLNVDVNNIVLCGSSAGAITVLQADYYLGNRMELAKVLPEDFRFAGVASFAGAIFSHEGSVKYRVQPPAPTLMMHGIDDKLVNYNQIRFFKLGLFGTNKLVKRFEKFNYPYQAVRYKGLGHEVAGFMDRDMETLLNFIDQYVVNKKFLQKDMTVNDPSIPHNSVGSFKPADLYKK